MQKKKVKLRMDKVKFKRSATIVMVLITLFLGGIWIGSFIYKKNNTVCEASAYGAEKTSRNVVIASDNNDKKSEELEKQAEIEKQKEIENQKELKKQEELKKEEEKRKQEEAAKAEIANKNIEKSNNYNYAVNVEDAYKKDGKKIAFLTFDDGPTRNITPEVLDTLKKYNVKATFFILGKMAEQNQDLVRRIANEGHAIANHSYSHEYSNIYSSSESFWGEINKTNSVFKNILGKDFSTSVFRFPGGSKGGNHEGSKANYRREMQERGYLYVDWNVENGDGKSSNFTPERLLQYVKEEASGNEHIVVLMHDAATKKTTAQALPSIIEYLRAQGYEFKVLR